MVYIGKTLPGGGNEELRRAVRGAVKATSAVLHDRKATPQDAALIAELSSSVHADAYTRNDAVEL